MNGRDSGHAQHSRKRSPWDALSGLGFSAAESRTHSVRSSQAAETIGSRPVNKVSGAGTSLISDHDADALELKKGSNSGEPKIALGYAKSREA